MAAAGGAATATGAWKRADRRWIRGSALFEGRAVCILARAAPGRAVRPQAARLLAPGAGRAAAAMAANLAAQLAALGAPLSSQNAGPQGAPTCRLPPKKRHREVAAASSASTAALRVESAFRPGNEGAWARRSLLGTAAVWRRLRRARAAVSACDARTRAATTLPSRQAAASAHPSRLRCERAASAATPHPVADSTSLLRSRPRRPRNGRPAHRVPAPRLQARAHRTPRAAAPQSHRSATARYHMPRPRLTLAPCPQRHRRHLQGPACWCASTASEHALSSGAGGLLGAPLRSLPPLFAAR